MYSSLKPEFIIINKFRINKFVLTESVITRFRFNLCTTATRRLGLFTGGRCYEVIYVVKVQWDLKVEGVVSSGWGFTKLLTQIHKMFFFTFKVLLRSSYLWKIGIL